jgi:hypothetical protein
VCRGLGDSLEGNISLVLPLRHRVLLDSLPLAAAGRVVAKSKFSLSSAAGATAQPKKFRALLCVGGHLPANVVGFV